MDEFIPTEDELGFLQYLDGHKEDPLARYTSARNAVYETLYEEGLFLMSGVLTVKGKKVLEKFK